MKPATAFDRFAAAVDACDSHFAAVEPFTKRANHRYNVRNLPTCPPSDAIHQEVAGYTDKEDFEAYNESYLDAHTIAIEALASAFEKAVTAYHGLPFDDRLVSTAGSLFKASLDLFEFNVAAYSRAAECAERDALQVQLKDAKNALAAIEEFESKGASADAGVLIDEAEKQEARGKDFERKAQEAGIAATTMLEKIEKAKIALAGLGRKSDGIAATEHDIKSQAAEITKGVMARYGTPKFEAEIAGSIAPGNAGVTHAEFAHLAKARQMGVKFVIRPSKLLRGRRAFAFSAMVCGYFFFPWLACPLWAWHEHSWWLLLGILVSQGATRTAANERKPPVGSGVILASIAVGLWAWLGIHSYWTYFVLCAAWGMLLFSVADKFESAAALKSLIERKEVFDRLASAGQIMIVRQ